MYRVGSSIKKSNQIRKSCVGANSAIRNYSTEKNVSNKQRYSEFVDDEEDMVIDTRKVVEKKVEVQEDVKDFDEMLASISMKELKLMRYRENPEVFDLFKKQYVDINDAFNMKITTKSIMEKEKLKKERELKGSQFKTQKVTYDNIAEIKSNYIAHELNKFKDQYEKPLVRMYNEITNQQNLLYRTKRAEEKLLKKKLEKQKKQYKLSSLERHYRDVVQVRNALDFRGKTILADKDEEDAWQRIVERTEISDPHNLARNIMSDEYNDLGYQTEIDEEYINLLSINPFDFANPNSYASMVQFFDKLAIEEEQEDEFNSTVTEESELSTITDSAKQIGEYLSKEERYNNSLIENYEFYKQMNRPSVANSSSITNLLETAKISLNAGSPPLNEEQIVDLLPYEDEVVEDPTEDVTEVLEDEGAKLEQSEDGTVRDLFDKVEEEYDEDEEVDFEEEEGKVEEDAKTTEAVEQQVDGQDVKATESVESVKPVESVESVESVKPVDPIDILKEQLQEEDYEDQESEKEEIDEKDIELVGEEDEEIKKLRELVDDVKNSQSVEEIPANKRGPRDGIFGLSTRGLNIDIEPNLDEYVVNSILDERAREQEWLANYKLEGSERDATNPVEDKMYEPLPSNLPDLEALSAKIRKAEEAELSLIADRFIDKEINEKTAHDLVDQIFDSYKTNNLFNPDIIEHDKNVIREANGDVAVPDSMYFEYDTTFRDLVDRDVVFKMPLKDTDLVRVLSHQLTEAGLLKQEKVLKYSPEVMPVSKELVKEVPDRFPNFVEQVLSQRELELEESEKDQDKVEESEENEDEEDEEDEESEEDEEDITTTTTTLSSTNSNSSVPLSTLSESTLTESIITPELMQSEGEIYDERRVYINLKPAVKDEGVLTIPTENKKLRWKLELEEAEKNDGWLMGKPFDMLAYRMNGQESTISSSSVQTNELFDEEYDEEAPLIEELVDEEDDDFRDLSPGCDQEPELFEETELFHYLQEGGDQEWFRPEKIGDADIKALESRQTWVPNQRQHIYTYPVQFVSTSNTTDQTKEDSWINRKAVMRVNIQAFSLPECVEQRLAELTGKRYDAHKKVLTLVASNHKTLNENKYEVKRIFRELLHEANLADPNFVSVRPDGFKPTQPSSFVPSDAAKSQNKFNLFRIQGGFPILTTQQKKQLELSAFIQSSLSN